MSEQRRIVSVVDRPRRQRRSSKKYWMGIERVGNKVPHPAVIFFILSGLVIVLSHVLYLAGTSVSYEVINPQTHKVEAGYRYRKQPAERRRHSLYLDLDGAKLRKFWPCRNLLGGYGRRRPRRAEG